MLIEIHPWASAQPSNSPKTCFPERQREEKYLRPAGAPSHASPARGKTMSLNEDRRHHQRRRVLKGGKIFYQDFAISVDCMIRDESEDGMQVIVDPNLLMPREVSILNRKDGTLADAKIVWRDQDRMGLELQSEPRSIHDFDQAGVRRLSIIAPGEKN